MRHVFAWVAVLSVFIGPWLVIAGLVYLAVLALS